MQTTIRTTTLMLALAASALCTLPTLAQTTTPGATQNVFDQANNDELKKHTEAFNNQTQAINSQTQSINDANNSIKAQLSAITGKRGIGNLPNIDSSSVRQTLPSDFTQRYDNLRKNGYSSATSEAQSMFTEYKKLCSPDVIKEAARRKMCEALQLSAPEGLAILNAALKKANDRMAMIQNLMKAIDDEGDLKRAADLGNRISAEMAMLQNEKMLMDMQMQAHSQQFSLTMQKFAAMQDEDFKKRMTSREGYETIKFKK
jgi:type IV secretion system protein VirB5